MINKILDLFRCKHEDIMPISATTTIKGNTEIVSTTWLCLRCDKKLHSETSKPIKN